MKIALAKLFNAICSFCIAPTGQRARQIADSSQPAPSRPGQLPPPFPQVPARPGGAGRHGGTATRWPGVALSECHGWKTQVGAILTARLRTAELYGLRERILGHVSTRCLPIKHHFKCLLENLALQFWQAVRGPRQQVRDRVWSGRSLENRRTNSCLAFLTKLLFLCEKKASLSIIPFLSYYHILLLSPQQQVTDCREGFQRYCRCLLEILQMLICCKSQLHYLQWNMLSCIS